VLAGAVFIVADLSLVSSRRPTKLLGVCLNNLRFIDNAKQMWAYEHHKTTNDPPPTLEDLQFYIGHGGGNGRLMPECPCGGTYMIGRLEEPPRCSLPAEEHTYARIQSHEPKP
jgi:hypothetical protein